MHAEAIEDSKGSVSAMQRSIAEREPIAADVAAKAKAARERLGRVERGEEVGSYGGAVPLKDLLATLGWKPGDIRQAQRLAEICEYDGAWEELMEEIEKRRRSGDEAARRSILAKRRRSAAGTDR